MSLLDNAIPPTTCTQMKFTINIWRVVCSQLFRILIRNWRNKIQDVSPCSNRHTQKGGQKHDGDTGTSAPTALCSEFPSVQRIMHGSGLVYPALGVFRPAAAFCLRSNEIFFVNRTRLSVLPTSEITFVANHIFWKRSILYNSTITLSYY